MGMDRRAYDEGVSLALTNVSICRHSESTLTSKNLDLINSIRLVVDTIDFNNCPSW